MLIGMSRLGKTEALGTHGAREGMQMRNRFLRFTFEREAKWLVLLCVLFPLVGIVLSILIPAILRNWFG